MATEYSPSEIVTQLGQRQLAMYFNVAALAIFVFDYCVTFSSEVQHIWGRKWETTRFVFTMSRYVPFIGSAMTCYNALYSHKCGSFIFALDAIYNIGIVFAEGILILRTYAMWQRSRRVLFFLLGLAVVFIVAATVLATKLNFSLPADAGSPYVFYPSSCAFGKSRNGAFQYILLMIYEIILQGMNTWKRFRTYRDVQSSTLRTLYWGGIMYMFGIIVLSASNMAIMVAAPIAYIDLLDTAQLAIHSVLASRIFFNLRECDKRIHDGVSAGSSGGVSTEYEIPLMSLSHPVQLQSTGRRRVEEL